MATKREAAEHGVQVVQSRKRVTPLRNRTANGEGGGGSATAPLMIAASATNRSAPQLSHSLPPFVALANGGPSTSGGAGEKNEGFQGTDKFFGG